MIVPMAMLKMRSLERCLSYFKVNLISEYLVEFDSILLFLVMKFVSYIMMLDLVTTGLQ